MTRLWQTPSRLRRDWRRALWPLRTIRWWQWTLASLAAMGYVLDARTDVTLSGLLANSVLILILLMFLEDTWRRRQPQDENPT